MRVLFYFLKGEELFFFFRMQIVSCEVEKINIPENGKKSVGIIKS
jgi:hypothetical protein